MSETVYETDNLAVLGWRNPGDIEFVFRARGLFTEQRCTWASVTRTENATVQVRVVEPCMLNVKLSTGGGGPVAAAQAGQDPQTMPSLAAPLIARNMAVERTENIFDADPLGPTVGFSAAPPGTWYFDRAAAQLLYKPQPSDDMAIVDAVLPVLEQLVVGQGQSLDRPLRNITLSGLTFSHTTWLDPNTADGSVRGSTPSLCEQHARVCEYFSVLARARHTSAYF
jgi:hypothetical protein